MPRFFVKPEQIFEDRVVIEAEDAHHIARSLRMATGESLTVCDTQGYEYDCRISSFEGDRAVYAEILEKRRSEREPSCRIRLFQALPKGDKLDTVIQKAVECGVSEIIPFESERCIVKRRADGEERKNERRARIAAEAAKQCGRSVIPAVKPTIDFCQMLESASESALCLFCYEGEGTKPLGRILAEHGNGASDIAVVIGSEGGFSPEEAETAQARGMQMTGLGKRILRTETASSFVLACLVCATELQ